MNFLIYAEDLEHFVMLLVCTFAALLLVFLSAMHWWICLTYLILFLFYLTLLARETVYLYRVYTHEQENLDA